MEQLIDWRGEIDEINAEIVGLLAKRKEVVQRIGEYKKENDLPILDAEREKIVFDKIEALAEEKGLNKEFVRDLFERIIKQARKDEEWLGE